MKLMVVSANSLDPTGEAQYFRHLIAGFQSMELGADIEVTAVALNGRGHPLKYDLRPGPSEHIEYLPYKKFAEVANQHDYVIISTARFKGDYSWMKDLKTPYGVVVHSLPSIEAHCMKELWETKEPYAIYVLDASIRDKAIEFGANPASIFYVGLPFSYDIMGPRADLADGIEPYVIVPARIHFVKYPGAVAKMLVEVQKQVPDLVGVFFGSEDFFYYNNLKEIVEANDTFLTLQEPYLNEKDKAKWWNWCTIAVDGTRLPKPPMRMQYSMLEAGYFWRPILVDEQRHSRIWNAKLHQLPLSAENIVRVLQDQELRYNMALCNEAYVKTMHDARAIALELLSPIIYDWRPACESS